MPRHDNGRWWDLYLLVSFFAGLLFVIARAHVSAMGHKAMAVAVVLACFALIFVWVESQSDLLEEEGVDSLAQGSRPRRAFVSDSLVVPARPAAGDASMAYSFKAVGGEEKAVI